MCGISGYSRSKQYSEDSIPLPIVSKILQHRGPDDTDCFEDYSKGVGLAHNRLSILELSSLGHQPMFSDDRSVVLVFNGEIYNFREIRRELEIAGEVFRGGSDTEVLLRLYMLSGRQPADLKVLLRRLNGIFAFALWDNARDEMLLARDALGVKPLYYAEFEEQTVFASEIKALIGLVDGTVGLNVEAIHRYLTYLWCPGEGTPAANIKKLDPGAALWLHKGRISERIDWYQLPMFRQSAPRQPLTENQAVSGTAELLRQAVHRQMVADVPVGAFLSGGLDSSAVVAFAREVNPDIRCFSIEQVGGAEPGFIDDLPYARRVATQLNVSLEIVRIDAARMAEDLAEMVVQLDEPLADPAPLNVLYISRLARENGLKVLLSGAGGDDLFTGYRRHHAMLLERYWTWLPRSCRKALELMSEGLDQRHVLGRRMRKLFNGAALDGDARLANYFAWNKREDIVALFSAEFRDAVCNVDTALPMMDFLARLPATVSPLERMLALEQRFFLADHNLIYTDKMSMAAGVEVRVPFLDLELVEFAARIPARFKQRGSEGKWVLKRAMEPYLPRDVIYRPKSGFGAPLRRWMRVELRDLLADVLGTQSLRQRGLFDPTAVQRLIQANDQGKVDASYTLLSLMCIELWCRKFIDQGLATPSLSGNN
jgi:asparagine synthase (glutamine-hydrolysing)